MKQIVGFLFLILFAAAASASNVYRWTDDSGRTIYSDHPPPPKAKGAQQIRGRGNVIEGQKPYELARAEDRFPVTLYVTACGPVCDKAREHLQQRGVSYTERDPQKDVEIAAELKRLTGAVEVPVLVVGNASPIKGFNDGSWDTALDLAGYPKSSVPGKKTAPKVEGPAKAGEPKPEAGPAPAAPTPAPAAPAR